MAVGEGGKEGEPLVEGEGEEIFLLVPEPDFMRAPVSFAIEGTKRTVQAVGEVEGSGEVEMVGAERFAEVSKRDARWKEKALREADRIVEGVPVRWVRDGRGVVVAAVLDGESMDVCASLFASRLVEKYESVFGPEFYVAVPSRFRLYLFPKLVTRIGEFASVVLTDYRATAYPVSQEVFEVSRWGVRAIGVLDDR